MNLSLGHREERRPWLAKRQMLLFLISRHHICRLGIFVPSHFLTCVWCVGWTACIWMPVLTVSYPLKAVNNLIHFYFISSDQVNISSQLLGSTAILAGLVTNMGLCESLKTGMHPNITIEWMISSHFITFRRMPIFCHVWTNIFGYSLLPSIHF